MRIITYLSFCLFLLISCGQNGPEETQNSYDLVIVGGRVIDPESGWRISWAEEINDKGVILAMGKKRGYHAVLLVPQKLRKKKKKK